MQHHSIDHTLTFIFYTLILIHLILLALRILTLLPEQSLEVAAGRYVLKNVAKIF